MDVMLQKLEKYAYHLESQVKERTAALEDEKRKTDMLLYRMLPPLAVFST
jgi:nitrate/nitrite-specific signal transduction histidine kinase